MKLLENTTYYCVRLEEYYRTKVHVHMIKVIEHHGNCKTMPTQRIIFEYNGEQQTSTLQFDDYELKHQNDHIFMLSKKHALCLTIADCKQFIREFYKANSFGIIGWNPTSIGCIPRIMYHNTLINFNEIIKQQESLCTQL